MSTCIEEKGHKGLNGGFTLYSWNINGLRTIEMNQIVKNLQNPAIISVQETKISRDQLDESKAFIGNYSSYFAFCRNKPGYSGVGTYCSAEATPCKAEEGVCGALMNASTSSISISSKLKVEDLIQSDFEIYDDERSHSRYGDNDGRCIVTQYKIKLKNDLNDLKDHQNNVKNENNVKLLTLFNVYCPRLRKDPEDTINNEEFKLTFHTLLARRAKSLLLNGGHVIIAGDLNICHKGIDQPDKNDKELIKDEFREWLDDLVGPDGDFVDTFRHLHPNREKAYTCWCTRTNARQNNYGARIDFILADKQLSKYLESAEIHPEIMGSDHCPISATFHTVCLIPSPKLPQIATKNYPEFKGGLQSNLKSFLMKNKNKTTTTTATTTQNQSSNTSNTGTTTTTATTTTQSQSSNFSSTTTINNNNKNSSSSSKSKQTSLTNFFTKRQKLEIEKVEIVEENIDTNGPTNSNKLLSSTSSTTTTTDTTTTTIDKSKSSWTYKEVDNSESSQKWRSLFKAPVVPLCSGHSEPCTQRTVRKKGENFGRQFWACSRGAGPKNDPNANCNFFKWARNSN